MWMLMNSIYVVLCSSLVVSVLADSNSKPLTPSSSSSSSPYLSPTTILNYQKMVHSLKIFIYESKEPQLKYLTPVESLFHSSLKNSPYLTQNPDEAHLFFLPFYPNLPTRSLARIISHVRTHHPFWNRTLGADHFYLSCHGIAPHSDRNIVELKKNAIQISCFPTRRDRFVPHKDLTLPPLTRQHAPGDTSLGGSFCVGEYGNNVSFIGEAMRLGCVPVVVVGEEPVNDVPFMDVLRWGEMAMFVKERLLGDDTWKERHEKMRVLGVEASKHLVWNQPPLPFDAFNSLMYQLWLRRHTVRYATVQ